MRALWYGGVLALVMILTLSACGLEVVDPATAARQTEVRATELELYVAQTLNAQRSTAQASALLTAGLPATTPSPPPIQPAGATEPPLPTLSPSETPPALDEEALRERMKTANILLYEDMVAHTDTKRYVKEALLTLGLPFKDDGNAKGWLVKDLEQGPPGGGVWDLVILALEDQVGMQGEFFDFALHAIEQGASVILEVHFLDQTYLGSGQPLLARCGVEYQGNRRKIPPGQMALFVLDPAHPLLQEPNANISFTTTSNYWWDPTGRRVYDTGDLVKRTPNSAARLLLGSQPQEKDTHGVLTVCSDDRLILQTFASHTLAYESGWRLWQNSIYFALKRHFAP